jgi:hypothetical protein
MRPPLIIFGAGPGERLSPIALTVKRVVVAVVEFVGHEEIQVNAAALRGPARVSFERNCDCCASM